MISAPPMARARGASLPAGVAGAVRDVFVVTRRNLVHIVREPMQLSDVTIQPVLFTLLFVYVFGSGIAVPGGTYAGFALAGLLLLNLTTSSMGTAVGLTVDLRTGVIDRFRTLPMWSAAVLVGRSITDVLTATLCTLIVAGSGLVVGWRPKTGIAQVAAGFGIARLFAYALSWLAGCVGLWARGAETAQSFGFLVLFPISFVSNALVPTRGMPDWLRMIVDWNPVSAVTAACRELWGNPNPSARSARPGLCSTRCGRRSPGRSRASSSGCLWRPCSTAVTRPLIAERTPMPEYALTPVVSEPSRPTSNKPLVRFS